MRAKLTYGSACCSARIFLFVACLFFAGCISVPQLKTHQSGIQGSAIQADHFLGVTVLRSASFVSGVTSNKKTATKVIECQANPIQVSISFHGIEAVPSGSDQRLCRSVRDGVRFIDGLAGVAQRFSRRYEIYLVPWGAGYSKSTLSWMPFGTLRLVFVAYWYPNNVRKTRAQVLDTAAHETAHLWSKIKSVEESDIQDEEMAYSAGACALLQVEGQIYEEDLSWMELTDVAGEMRTSSIAGVRQSHDLRPLFDSGVLRLDSKHGKAYSDQCQSVLRSYFNR